MPEVVKDDPAIVRAREIFAKFQKEKQFTLDQLGIAMGFESSNARIAAFQFLHDKFPRIDAIRKFAKAVGVPLSELIVESVVEPGAKKYQRAIGK